MARKQSEPPCLARHGGFSILFTRSYADADDCTSVNIGQIPSSPYLSPILVKSEKLPSIIVDDRRAI